MSESRLERFAMVALAIVTGAAYTVAIAAVVYILAHFVAKYW